jgi:hypothetical protein
MIQTIPHSEWKIAKQGLKLLRTLIIYATFSSSKIHQLQVVRQHLKKERREEAA